MLSIGQCATLACLLEATAPKPGNVHRGADFEDLTYADLTIGGVAIASAMQAAADGASLGETVLAAIRDTRRAVAKNTNLGTVLLLAPLAIVPRNKRLAEGVSEVLSHCDAADARLVYEAIRLAQPGGLGEVDEADVAGPPPDDLVAVMRLAAERDLVARQYANGFDELLTRIVPWLREGVARGRSLADTIVDVHLRTMCEFPDSLIRRKCGPQIAQEAADRAAAVLDAGEVGSDAYGRGLADLDFWLRADHHRRNPGTTADLIAAGLFVALRDGIIELPFRFYG